MEGDRYNEANEKRPNGIMATITDIATLIVRSPQVLGDCPRIAGTRISVQQIALLHKQGLSAADIIAEYEFLNLAQVYAALAYYYANQAEIETCLAAEEAEYAHLVAGQIAQ
jgi:uncharacterized protein (DUF433 family)